MQAFAWFPLGKQWMLSLDLWNKLLIFLSHIIVSCETIETVFSFEVVKV